MAADLSGSAAGVPVDGAATFGPVTPGDPTLRWSSQATSIPGIEH